MTYLGAEVRVEFACQWLQGATVLSVQLGVTEQSWKMDIILGQKIRAAVPPNIRQRMEVACNTRNGLHWLSIEARKAGTLMLD